MAHDGSYDHEDRPGVSIDRRVVMKAVAGFTAIAAAGGVSQVRPAIAQDATSTTVADTYTVPAGEFSAAATGEWTSFPANFEFYALGVSWPGDAGSDVRVEVQLGPDDWNWSESTIMTANTEDGGRPNRDGRLFSELVFSSGASYVRYRMQDSAGNGTTIPGLEFHYIDAEAGPSEEELSGFSAAAEDTSVSPPIVSRAGWGANESYRTWAPEYQTVEHVIIHHSASHVGVTNWAAAVRSVYYYHAIEQDWGDIGYNYIVSPTGTIYEGRYGGQNVIGGHAYQYANGTSGICLMGDFNRQAVPGAGLSAIIAISAWVARDLDPLGTNTFQEIIQLPTIASHRDVVSSSCPGDNLWADLPEIRQAVAQTIDGGSMETNNPGGIVIGDRVTVTTDDQKPLNVRSSANGSVTGSAADGTAGLVLAGPTRLSGGNWYQVRFPSITGWVSATYLTVTPPAPPAFDDTFYFGVNISINSATYVRSSPNTSSANLGTAPANTKGFILAGPASGSGREWYQVAFPNDVVDDGWVTKPVLTVSQVVDNPSGARFSVPAFVQSTDRINVRVRPGISQTIQTTIASGTRFRLSVAPKRIDGYIFYGAYGTFGGGWVVQDYLRADPNAPANRFQTGNWVRATDQVNLRRGAGTSNAVIRAIRPDEVAQITGGPSVSNGYVWYLMRFTDGTTGWSIQDFFTTTTRPSAAKFVVNDTFRVAEKCNLRTAASLSASVITAMNVGVTGKVLGGPTVANGYTWWRVQTSVGTGWTVENFLTKTTGGTTTAAPGGKFVVNDTFSVAEKCNLRTAASLSASVITAMNVGVTGKVLGGPTVANGYTWWRVQTSVGTGWTVENFLTKTTGGTTTPAPSGKFRVNDGIRVTEAVNLRSSATTSASVIAVLPTGTTGTVLGGPTVANGYTWWRIQTSRGTGWAVEDWLAKSTGSTTAAPGGRFTAGQSIRVTEAMRLRAAASTSSTIIANLPAGTTGTVLGGPSTGSGYTWWRIQTSFGTGWAAENWLVAGSSSGGNLTSGSTAQVFDGNLNLRSSASTSASVVTILPDGASVTIVGGPTTASGYTWWQVQSSAGTGWVVGQFIRASS